MSGSVSFYRPEATGIRSQHFIGENDLAVLVQTELEFGVGNEDALRTGIIRALDIKCNGRIFDLLRVFLAVAGECLLQNVDALLVGNVLVVITDLCLRAGCVDRFREFITLPQALRKADAADGTVFLIACPAGAGDVSADDALNGDHGQLAAQHAASAEFLGAEEFRHVVYIDAEHVIWDDILGIVEPEAGHLRQNAPLVRDIVLQNDIECRDPVSGVHNQRIADVVNLAYLSFFDGTELLHVFLLLNPLHPQIACGNPEENPQEGILFRIRYCQTITSIKGSTSSASIFSKTPVTKILVKLQRDFCKMTKRTMKQQMQQFRDFVRSGRSGGTERGCRGAKRQERKMRNTTIGILAHVDAGKTTLSESILFHTGVVKKRGRVDHGDAFLDTDKMEKKRGITIYSKLARFQIGDRPFTILDTPGHVDFSPEMERVLRVLDAAVLVVSAADLTAQEGADPQVRILWKLLQHYQVPAFVFINKVDQLAPKESENDPGEVHEVCDRLFRLLAKDLGQHLVRFDERQICEENEEAIAVCEDALMERVLEGGTLSAEDVRRLVTERKLFPVYCGSALKDVGTRDLLKGLDLFTGWSKGKACTNFPDVASGDGQEQSGEKGGGETAPAGAFGRIACADFAQAREPSAFGALVYKITRENGTRLTWMKVTSGTLSVRDGVREVIPRALGAIRQENKESDAQDAIEEEELPEEKEVQEKISELRLYSGDRYETKISVGAGEIVAAAGLSYTRAGDGLGSEKSRREEILTPIMTSTVTATDRFGKAVDDFTLMKALRELEEQEPMLHVTKEEETGDITVRIMGPVQIEILKNLLREKNDLRAQFGPGSIVYQETIRRPVEGVGHFEPLRHYAEVHLLLEPGEDGSGITFENRCIPGMLDSNWQNLILSQLSVKSFKGVLTGAGLTDVRICLLGGKASKKHTSGGDFRKAAYAAVRQGLMMAENILLEPVLNVTLELPAENVGRAMTDISKMHGVCRPAEFHGEEAVLEGKVPASELGDYAAKVAGYTGGKGKLSVSWKGYEPCHNAREIIEEKGYDPDADRRNPTWSVFCSHGAGTVVSWDQVRNYMHVDTGWQPEKEGGPYRSDDYYTFAPSHAEELQLDRTEETEEEQEHAARREKVRDFKERQQAFFSEEEELKRIFEKTYGPVKEPLRHPDNVRRGLVLPSEENAEEGGPSESNPQNMCAGPDSGNRQGQKGTCGAGRDGTVKRAGRKAAGRERQEFLLVDGYNIIFAWEELKELAETDIKSARDRLLDLMSDYAGYSGENVIVVFDAYRVPGGSGEVSRYHNIDVVYTKEAETADLYIEKTAHRLSKNNRVTVATGDFVEQVIIFGAGAFRLSPRGLLEQILFTERELREKYLTE